eukprot:COSAG02_NODE_2254_length_9348_cov_2.773273_3_plen_36_part_00
MAEFHIETKEGKDAMKELIKESGIIQQFALDFAFH